MVTQNGNFASVRRVLWNRVRFQLGMGWLFAVLVPYFVRYQLPNGGNIDSLHYSVAGSVVALLGGYYGFRKISCYPGVRASYHILPSFAISYGMILVFFFFFRIDYSRFHFLLSFALCVFWYYIVHFKLQRQQRLRIAVLPFGKVEALCRVSDVHWFTLGEDELLANRDYDAIVADLRADIPDTWERFLADRALQGLLVMHVKQVEESLTGRVAIEHLSENNFGSLIPGIVYAKLKRAGDLFAAIVAVPLLLPFLPIVAVLIRFDSPGPVFFRQERMGYRGVPFTVFKFRTMVHCTGQPDDSRIAAMTRDGDDRVTRLGKFLRQYRVDELPQLVNILRGEMSWIGPRPEAAPLSQWYEAELPFYRYRHIVRPGITGWAQVNQGHVADVDEVLGKLHYDFYYIKNFSVWLDILIVARTIRTIWSGFGAR